MSNTSFHIEGFEELSRSMQSMINFVKRPRRVYAGAKVIMLQDVMDHFRKQEGPDVFGTLKKWKKLSPLTIHMRRKGKRSRGMKILQDKGILIGSIGALHGSQGAEVGTNVDYAKDHQYGNPMKNIPKRAFLWISDLAAERILNLTYKEVQESLK